MPRLRHAEGGFQNGRSLIVGSVFEDDNGNGVLNKDIASGKDRLVMPPQSLKFLGRDYIEIKYDGSSIKVVSISEDPAADT